MSEAHWRVTHRSSSLTTIPSTSSPIARPAPTSESRTTDSTSPTEAPSESRTPPTATSSSKARRAPQPSGHQAGLEHSWSVMTAIGSASGGTDAGPSTSRAFEITRPGTNLQLKVDGVTSNCKGPDGRVSIALHRSRFDASRRVRAHGDSHRPPLILPQQSWQEQITISRLGADPT